MLDGDKTSIFQDQSSIYFESNGVLIIARQLARNFPQIDNAIPKSFIIKVLVKSEDTKNALRLASPLTDKDNSVVNLTLTSDSCTITVQGKSGNAETSCPAEQIHPDPMFEQIPPYQCTVNHDYLADFFESVSGDVIMGISAEKAPLYLECGNKKLLAMVQK